MRVAGAKHSVALQGNAVKHFCFKVSFAQALYREAVAFHSPGSRALRRSRWCLRTPVRIPHKVRTPKAFHKNEHVVKPVV